MMCGLGWLAGPVGHRLGHRSRHAAAGRARLCRTHAQRHPGRHVHGRRRAPAGRRAPIATRSPASRRSARTAGASTRRWIAAARRGQSGLPIVVPMHFVGDTPVIMMTDTSLPASARSPCACSSTATATPAPGSTARPAARCRAASRRRRSHPDAGAQSLRTARPSRSQRSPPSGRIVQVTRISTRRPAALVTSACERTRTRPSA